MSKSQVETLPTPEIKLPRLWLLTNRLLTIGQPLPRIVRHSAAAGIKMTIMTETDLAPWVALELAEKLAEEMHAGGGRLLVSERADLAHLSDADGVLTTTAGLPADRLKSIFNKAAVVGVLVRGEQELKRGSLDAIDFVLATGIFPSDDLDSSPQDQDLDRLRRIVHASTVPVIAAGGMTPQRAPHALEAGARGIAMSEVAMESLNMGLLVEAFRKAMGRID